jgi:hypothetical protein
MAVFLAFVLLALKMPKLLVANDFRSNSENCIERPTGSMIQGEYDYRYLAAYA